MQEFIQKADFKKLDAPVLISVYNFSGQGFAVKNYVPGNGGFIVPNQPHSGMHYVCEVFNADVNGLSAFSKKDILEKIEKMEPIGKRLKNYIL